MRFHNRVFLLAMISFFAARPGAVLALPVVPEFPNFAKLGAYDPPAEKSNAEALEQAIKDFKQFVQADLPDFYQKNQASARRTGTYQWLMQSPDGRELLYIDENKGLASALHFYRIADPAAGKLDPRLSRAVEFMNRGKSCMFSNQAGQHVTITIGESPQVTAYGALGLGDRVYQAFWNPQGRLVRQGQVPLQKLQATDTQMHSADFLAKLDPKPYQGASFERPPDKELAATLESVMRAMNEDLNETAGLVQSGKMKWTAERSGQVVGRFEAGDRKKIVGLALSPNRKNIAQVSSTLYDRIPEIRESVLREARFTFHSTGAGIYDYKLHTPQFEARLEFRVDHTVNSFRLDWFPRGESKTIVWDEKGKIKPVEK